MKINLPKAPNKNIFKTLKPLDVFKYLAADSYNLVLWWEYHNSRGTLIRVESRGDVPAGFKLVLRTINLGTKNPCTFEYIEGDMDVYVKLNSELTLTE